jgi:hypothetical protein
MPDPLRSLCFAGALSVAGLAGDLAAGESERLEVLLGDARAEAAHFTIFSRTTGRLAGEPVPKGASAEECAAAFERAASAVSSQDEPIERRGPRVAYPATLEVEKHGTGCQPASSLSLASSRSETLMTYAGEGCPGCTTISISTYFVPSGCRYVSHRTRVASAHPNKASELDADATEAWSYVVAVGRDSDGQIRRVTPRALVRSSGGTGPQVWIALEVEVTLQCLQELDVAGTHSR